MVEKSLDSYKEDIFNAIFKWQSICSEKGADHPDTNLASGYLYDRVRRYQQAKKKQEIPEPKGTDPGPCNCLQLNETYPLIATDIYKALGWQGGTIHQVVREIKRLKRVESKYKWSKVDSAPKDREIIAKCLVALEDPYGEPWYDNTLEFFDVVHWEGDTFTDSWGNSTELIEWMDIPKMEGIANE